MVDAARRSSPQVVEGEFVDPHLLHAVVDRVVPTGAADVVELSAEQIVARSRREDVPRWARDLPLSARVRLRGALARAGFDLQRRLDDRTLVAPNPEGGGRPLVVLELGRPGVDLTRIDLFQLELAAAELLVVDPDRRQALDAEPPLRAVAVRPEDLPRSLTRYRPGLVLRERLRLALAFDALELGGPISMLTLLPGERRSVRIIHTTETRVEETSELGTESRASRELTRSLQREFRHDWERHRERQRLRGVVWSREEAAEWPAGEVSSEREISDEGEEAWSLESSAVREALDRAALSVGSEVEEIRVREGIRERVDERERTEVVELENSREDRAVTYVAHHVLATYRAHLDLVDAELLRQPDDPTAPTTRVDLRGDWRTALQELPGLPGTGTLDAVAGLLQARYGDLGALDDDGSRLLPRPADAVNLDLTSRDLMLAPDRRDRRGPLPVCLLSRRLAVRTGGTFVRTYADDPGITAASLRDDGE